MVTEGNKPLPEEANLPRGEVEKLPKLTLRAPTAEEEFERIWQTLTRSTHYQETGTKPYFPDHPRLQELARDYPKLKQGTKERMRQVFVSEVYDERFYETGKVALENSKRVIDLALRRMVEFENLWRFKVFDEYEVVLTRYGTGASCNPKTGIIRVRCDESGRFARPDPVHTVVHEIVHLGIEETIVQKYGLSHFEKERLVDLMCVILFEDLLPDYQPQPAKDRRIDSYVTRETLCDLARAVAEYKSRDSHLPTKSNRFPVVEDLLSAKKLQA